LSQSGWDFVNDSFSPERGKERFDEIFQRVGKETLMLNPPPSVVPVTAVPSGTSAKRKRK